MKNKKLKYILIALYAIGIILVSTLSIHRTIEKYTSSKHQVYEEYTVEYGDTLWDIARKHMPDVYTPEAIEDIRSLNNAYSMIHPGDRLLIPVSK